MRSITVLGSGLSGLSYAYGWLKKGRCRVVLIEKDYEIGGLLKTFNFNGFLFDFGPHIFRSKDEKVMKFVKTLLRNNYLQVNSNPAIFKYGKFFDNVIPVITWKNIEKLPREKKNKVLKEIRNTDKPRNCNCFKNFEDCIISQIGETLYWEFFRDYSKKWWGINLKKLSADLAPKNLRIGGEKFYGHLTTNFERLNEEIYPVRGGIFEIARKLGEKVRKLGGSFLLNSNIKSLECDGERVSKIIIETIEEEVEIDSCENLIVSTIPLPSLCKMLNIKFKDILYRSEICIFIKLNGKQMFKHSWIYFHDPEIIFSRIYEPLYYNKYAAPKGFTSLCVEVTCFENDKIWNDKHLGEKVIDQLIDTGIIKRSQEPEVLGIAKYPYAYPIYTVDYKQKLREIFDKLKIYENLRIIGRTGSFSYLNMWECLKWAVY